MADVIDQSDITQQKILDAKIQNITCKPLDTSNPTGICWASDCEQVTGKERRWCDADCRDAYELRDQ